MAETPGIGQQPTQAEAIPLCYFNGFNLLVSTDFGCVLLVDGQPQLRLAMSAVTAKALAGGLAKAVEHYETATKSTILRTEDIIC